jgi:hypothetical protein
VKRLGGRLALWLLLGWCQVASVTFLTHLRGSRAVAHGQVSARPWVCQGCGYPRICQCGLVESLQSGGLQA